MELPSPSPLGATACASTISGTTRSKRATAPAKTMTLYTISARTSRTGVTTAISTVAWARSSHRRVRMPITTHRPGHPPVWRHRR